MGCRRLHLPRHRQRGIKVLVVDDNRLIDLPHFVENTVGQGPSLMLDLELAIGIFAKRDAFGVPALSSSHRAPE
jgi:hypothetical protein